MPRFDLFSKRLRDASSSGKSDVYQYDDVTRSLRVQATNILSNAYGPDQVVERNATRYTDNKVWLWIEKTYLHELGKTKLGINERLAADRVKTFFANARSGDALDILELIAYRLYEKDIEVDRYRQEDGEDGGGLYTSELNYRMREAGLGYQSESGLLVRVDSQFVHAEIVKPALKLLSRVGFAGPEEEFLEAHQHYRRGEHKQAVALAANALESTFKAIFDLKGWQYQKGSRISDLVKVARDNELWPNYLDKSFDQLVAMLQSGLPKIRDNDASHGQGSTPREVPGYVASYALGQAASSIVFVIEAAS